MVKDYSKHILRGYQNRKNYAVFDGETSIGIPSPENCISSRRDLDLLTSKSNQFIFVQNCTEQCKFDEIATNSLQDILLITIF